MLESFSEYQITWGVYVGGALLCALATWMLFRPLGRALAHFFVITVLVLLLTPFAVESEAMIMAPGIFHLFFGFLEGGFTAVKPVIKLMLGIWVVAQVVSLLYQLLTRNWGRSHEEDTAAPYPTSAKADPADVLMSSSRGLSREERYARDELLSDTPIRAQR